MKGMMVNLYQNEVEDITKVVEKVSQSWWGKTASGENLALFHKELLGRLQDIGFEADVDVTPVLAGLPATVAITNRIESTDFDIEKRQHELQTMRDRNEKRPDIEGNV